MEQLYERLIEVLGRPPRHKVVRRFLSEIEQAPTVEKLGYLRQYQFDRFGFEWDYDPRLGYIASLGVYYGEPDGWGEFCQGWRKFEGQLPAGITRYDTRDDVRRRLNLKPIRSGQDQLPVRVPPKLSAAALKDWLSQQAKEPYAVNTDLYLLPPYKLSFVFRIKSEKLIWVSIFRERASGG